jgi:hypothetical protein
MKRPTAWRWTSSATLTSEPVLARPPSRLYRLQKLVRRNKIVFAAGGAVALALLIGLGMSTWLFFREREAEPEKIFRGG